MNCSLDTTVTFHHTGLLCRLFSLPGVIHQGRKGGHDAGWQEMITMIGLAMENGRDDDPHIPYHGLPSSNNDDPFLELAILTNAASHFATSPSTRSTVHENESHACPGILHGGMHMNLCQPSCMTSLLHGPMRESS